MMCMSGGKPAVNVVAVVEEGVVGRLLLMFFL